MTPPRHVAPYMNSSAQKAACAIGDFIYANDKADHIHYGCSWQFREDGIYHVCYEEKREWKI